MSIDFTNYDYDSLVERITELYKDKPGLGEGYDSSTGQMLIQLLADVNDHLFFMLERRAQESFIETARLDSSIRARASELGYRPRRRVSSTGTLEVTIVDDDGNPIVAEGNIFIPNGTTLTSNDIDFVTTSDATIQTGESSVEVPIKEGVPRSQRFNFDVEPYLSDPTIVVEDYNNIEEFSLEVSDASGEYSDIGSYENQRFNITSLSYAMPTDMVYDIRFTNEGMRIMFGDGTFGKKPTGNVDVSWVESSGDEVNIISTGLEFQFSSEFLTDDQNVSPSVLYRYQATNITPVRGGQDEEDVREIARNASEFARTANRAVTSSDHEFWVMRSGVGDIVDVKAYGEQETDELIFNMNNVQISYVTGDQLPLNIEQEQQLREFMDRYKMATTHLAFKEASQVDIVLDIDFKRDNQLPITNEHTYQVVKGYIDDYFAIGRGSIGKEFQHSEFVRFLQASTYMFNGINYPLADWVKVGISAQYPIEVPILVYDVLVYLDDSYTFVNGDILTITLDGVDHSVTVQTGDTKDVLMERMRVEISNNTSLLTAIEGDNNDIIRIKAPYLDSDFTISVNQGDLASFMSTDVLYQIPPSTLTNPQDENLIYPGSVKILDLDENVIFEDDGLGMMQPVNGELNPAFAIDYVECALLSPTMDAGSYLIRYSQNEFQNVDSNFRSVLTLSPLAENLTDPFLYSKLRVF